MSGSLNKVGVLLLSVWLSGCASFGHTTIERDHLDYGMAFHDATKKQLLNNIVRLRYLEAPVFVDVSSVINQYALIGRMDAALGTSNALIGGDTANLGGSGQWEDRPTITYTPVSGRAFAESLLTPIDPEALFALVQSGWPAELMFRLTVSSMNGVRDANRGERQADPEYRKALGAWKRLRDDRAIGLRRTVIDEKKVASILVYIDDTSTSPQRQADIAYIREVFRLNPDKKEYVLKYGLVPDKDDQIAVMTQSVLEIVLDLAWQVDVPDEHIQDGRTKPTFVDSGEGGPLFKVRYSEEKPEDAFTAIWDRGYWFYIDDRDMVTKRTFGVLQILLSLTESGRGGKGPVVTIGG